MPKVLPYAPIDMFEYNLNEFYNSRMARSTLFGRRHTGYLPWICKRRCYVCTFCERGNFDTISIDRYHLFRYRYAGCGYICRRKFSVLAAQYNEDGRSMVKYDYNHVSRKQLKWFFILRSIYVTNRQNYEDSNQRNYIVRIRIDNDAAVANRQELHISIENIIDNYPTITYEGPCHALVSCQGYLLRSLAIYGF